MYISYLVDDQSDFVNNFREHRNSVCNMYKPHVPIVVLVGNMSRSNIFNIQYLHHLALALQHHISYLRLKLFRCTHSIGLYEKKIVWTSNSSIFTTCFVKKNPISDWQQNEGNFMYYTNNNNEKWWQQICQYSKHKYSYIIYIYYLNNMSIYIYL